MNILNMSQTLMNLSYTYTQSFNYDFILHIKYELMIMIIALILLRILKNVSDINSSTRHIIIQNDSKESVCDNSEESLCDESEESVHSNEPEQDDLTQSIIELLSDKKKRKAREIISELNLDCDKKFLNRTYLYPMKKNGLLDSEEWFWKLS